MRAQAKFLPISTISKPSFEFLYHAFRQYVWFYKIQTNDKRARAQAIHWAQVFANTCADLNICDAELLWHFYNMRPDLYYLVYYRKVKVT